MRRIVIAFALAAPLAAHAQTESNLPSTPTGGAAQPSTGGSPAGGYYYPGMPVPQPPAATSSTGAPAAGEKEKKGPSGFYAGEEDEGFGNEPQVTVDRTPETYVVKRGDTLWSISGTYLRNPWAWPQLWALNPSITNPHWIYPGDVLRLLPPGTQPPENVQAPIKEPHRLGLQTPPPPGPLYLQQEGFIETKELAQSGKIVGSKEERNMLATLDEAYVEFDPKQPLEVGSRYSVYHPVREIRHPVTNDVVGELVRIYGEVEVKSVTPGHIARVLVVQSHDPIERGFLVGPLKRQFRFPETRAAAQDLPGVIVTTVRPVQLVDAWAFVFIDKGAQDGVQIGNRFLITRRGDGLIPINAKGPIDDPRFPREDVGEVVVLDTRDHLATGLVLRSKLELRVGDRAELRKGF